MELTLTSAELEVLLEILKQHHLNKAGSQIMVRPLHDFVISAQNEFRVKGNSTVHS